MVGQRVVSMLRANCLALLAALALTFVARLGFAWGHEGHEVIALIAQHYMTDATKAKARELLDGASIESVSDWAGDYPHERPENGSLALRPHATRRSPHSQSTRRETVRKAPASWSRRNSS